MAGSLDLRFAQSRFQETFARFIAATGGDMRAELKNQARLFVVDLVKVTPPFSQGGGQNATQAKKDGQDSIRRNLDRLFVGRTLVGSRKITHLFGKTDVPGLPCVVPTKEKCPDAAGIYASEKAAATFRGRGGFRLAKKSLPVSRKKVEGIYKKEIKKVGWLAGGWNAAARKLGAKVPAWVSRHSAPGRVRMTFTRTWLRILVVNDVSYVRRVGGMEKRIEFALRKRTDAMEANIPRILKRRAREARLGK